MLHPDERAAAEALSALSYCNPFTPERIGLERQVLGDAFVWTDDAWHKRADIDGVPPNIDLMTEFAGSLAERLRDRLTAGATATENDLRIYQDVVFYFVYNDYQARLNEIVTGEHGAGTKLRRHVPFYKDFRATLDRYFAKPAPSLWEGLDVPHLFACFFQLRRAFHYIHGSILGGSMLSARFRASVWESVFTHDTQRYRRALFNRMRDITTLITGPSGTGKELVARAIAYSRYIPFNADRAEFAEDYMQTFFPLNLSALSQTLIESELFGHKKGAFTGALQDRKGWLEVCSPLGTVFLDEIGEADPMIQVKLLRVLQTREFQPVGEIQPKEFQGKVVAATNRDLRKEMESGAFRQDLYYRLCSDIIVTPGLKDQIDEAPEQLHNLILYMANTLVGEADGPPLADETERYIQEHLGDDYAWPGNVRELEQCVRNMMVRRRYEPAKFAASSEHERLSDAFHAGAFTADELLSHYVSLVYAQTRNYQETGRRLNLDGRTVKAKVDPDLVERYRPK